MKRQATYHPARKADIYDCNQDNHVDLVKYLIVNYVSSNK